MLYLEDYLELIEHLPQEVMDRLTDMRELDLQVHNTLDYLEKQRIAKFFSNITNMEPDGAQVEHNAILDEYKKALDDSDEKIQISDNLIEIIGKYSRRLDQDLMKFKMELEADNPGITEIIENRCEEQEEVPIVPVQTYNSRRGNRRHLSYENPLHEMAAVLEKQQHSLSNVTELKQSYLIPSTSTSTTSQSIFNVDQMRAGGSAIAAAASQAIAATQQMAQGRRTASLKASYEFIHGTTSPIPIPKVSSAMDINQDLAGAAQAAVAAAQETRKRARRRRATPYTRLKRTHFSRGRRRGTVNSGNRTSVSPALSTSSLQSEPMIEEGSMSEDANAEDLERYCICNEIAYGSMVACDNKDCVYEWYHYSCVGITESPKGNWYCPQCTVIMRRNRNRRT